VTDLTPEQSARLKQLCKEAADLSLSERASLIERVRGDEGGQMADALDSLFKIPDEPTGTMVDPLAPGPRPAAPADPSAFREGEIVLNRFRILRVLGRGGMGEVYEAQDRELGPVALKTIRQDHSGDGTALRRFKQEVQLARRVTSPYVCRIHELFMLPENGPHRVTTFLTMELLEGSTLAGRMQQGPLPWSEAEPIAMELCQGLEALHAVGLVHRDFKPGNAMLAQRGNVTQAVVMDLGLALRPDEPTHGDSKLTMPGGIVGTPVYMAPEQATGGPLDHRSDLFSFGIVLSEMLTGRHPFRRASTVATMAAIIHDPPDLALPGTAQFPVGLPLLLRRLLAKSPDERYPSMREVRADLGRLASASQTGVAPPGREAAPRIPLIGRDHERAELVRLLNGALGGHGSLVLIGGEAGVGKTHLTRAILAEAEGRGCLTLRGHCSEMDGAPPYVPFIEMLEYSARVSPHESFRQAIGDAAPEVAKLMPELRRMYSDIPPPVDLPPEQQRRFLFNACRDFVERSARVSPLVAVFEDLHWADEPTLLLLEHLAQMVPTSPILLIGTYRDAEVDVAKPLARMLETVLRQKLATRMPLRRLTAGEVAAMLAALSGQTPPRSLAGLVFDETGGNPYFVEEVFQHLAEEGKLFDEKGAWGAGLRPDELQVPESARLVIGRRLLRLGGEVQGLMTIASVIGRSFSLDLLEELAGGRPDAALEAIEAAERARMVEAEPAGREPRYRFVHELVRQTLADTLSRPRRQRLHARVAQAVERCYAGKLETQTSTLAHHLFQAGAAADSEKTVAWLTRAARQAASSTAYEDALESLDNALLLTEGEQSVRVAELHAERATVLRSLGRLPAALGAYDLALRLFAANGEAGRFAETSIPVVLIYNWGVRLAEGLDAATRALDMLGQEASPRRIALLCGKALCASCYGDPDTALNLVDQIQQILGPVQEGPLGGMIWQLRTHLEWHSARIGLAEEAGRRAAQIFQASGDVWGLVDVDGMRACATVVAGRLQEGESIARQTVTLANRVGHWGCLWMCKSVFAEGCMSRGDLAGAERFAREVIELGEMAQIGWNFLGEAELANIARMRGLVPEALEWSRRALASERPRNSYSGYPQASLALTQAQTGDPEAVGSLRKTLPYLPRPGCRAPIGFWQSLVLAIEGWATIGRLEEAAALHPVAEEMAATGMALTFTSTLPRTAAGIAAACAGNWARAEEHHRAAIHMADNMPHRVAQAIARYWYADMLRARGDAAEARTLLGEALSMFESLDMPLYARRASE
jgi:tetratricopeptide (TPR) repeat protein